MLCGRIAATGGDLFLLHSENLSMAYRLTLSSGWRSLFVGGAAWLLLAPAALVGQMPLPPAAGYGDTPLLPGQPWRVHDSLRPRPAEVTAGQLPGSPPSDAIILFDGSDLDAWRTSGSDRPAGWEIVDGALQVVGGTGSISTRQQFGDVQLHLEFASPSPPSGSGQGRANSGVIFMERYEVQVLDSWQNPTYADGQLGAIYGQHPPLVNPGRPTGQWQSYDIIFEAPRFDGDSLLRPARITALLNGVLIHHAQPLVGQMAHAELRPYQPHAAVGSLMLQDHGDPVRFRNIWVRPLPTGDPSWLDLEPIADGPGAGKKVVLVSGDEEYRSEEGLTMLGQVLQQHGFRSVVLYAINPETGTIDPNYGGNIPGLHHLQDADAMIIATRFRSLPDWQMAHIADFLKRGGSVLGLRTATHAFNIPSDGSSAFEDWSWNSSRWPGGFGQQVLGETWVNHHGNHGTQATAGVPEPGAEEHPILAGVERVFGPSDVYGVRALPAGTEVLLRGLVLSGMQPDDPPLAGPKNDPAMPLAWVRTFTGPQGDNNRVFCTTMGASVDLVDQGLRRLLVNATYWACGLEDRIDPQADVDPPGDYQPSFFGFFNQNRNHFKDLRLTPVDFLVK